MTDADAFLQTILDDPDDDLPRLIFADWLEEHGDNGRAEFIRAQLERATLPVHSDRSRQLLAREKKLLRWHGAQWLQPIRHALGDPPSPGPVRRAVESALGRREVTSLGWHLENGVEFQRGFVHSLSLTTAALNTYGDSLVRLAPVEEMIVDVHYPFAEMPIAPSPALKRLKRLTVVGPYLTMPISQILSTRCLPALRSLCFAGQLLMRELTGLPIAPLAASLQHFAWFGGQRAYRDNWQSGSFLNDALLNVLLQWPLHGLESLTLECGYLATAGIAELASQPWPNLTALRLPRNSIDNVTAIANSPNFPALTMLDLQGNPVTDDSARVLANSPHLPNLALVYLEGNALTPGTRRVLHLRFGAGAQL